MNALLPIERARLRVKPDEEVEDFNAELEEIEPDPNDILSDLEFGPLPPDVGDGSTLSAAKVKEIHIAADFDERRLALEPPKALRLATSIPFVKLKRNLHTGITGRDVKALQRILRAAHCRTLAPTGHFRKVTKVNVQLFQKRHHLRQDGVVGPVTWSAMHPYMDGYTVWLVNHTVIRKPIADHLDHMVKVAWWYYARRPLHYLQQRPAYDWAPPPNVDYYLDCSEYVMVCSRAGGLSDPSGFGWTGYGNTDSFLQHMRHTWTPKRGDLALYANPGHVAIITGVSAQYHALMCLSHGSEGGPHYIPVHYRTPVAYLTWRS